MNSTGERAHLRRAVIASTIGTTIGWYDFFLYSIVTGLVFAKLFFPQSSPLSGTLQPFITRAVHRLETLDNNRQQNVCSAPIIEHVKITRDGHP